jgi:hypothetical protein
LFEPAEAAAGVLDGLAVGLEGEADVRSDELVGALVAFGHAAVVVGEAHFEDGDADALEPLAEAALAVPFGVPVGEEEDSATVFLPGEELRVDDVVLGPVRVDRTGEGQDVFPVEAVVGCWGCGVPLFARFDGLLGVLAYEITRIGVAGIAADVLEAPVEGLDATIVVGSPAAVLVAADAAFEPVHGRVDSLQFTVRGWSEERGETAGRKKEFNTEITEGTESHREREERGRDGKKRKKQKNERTEEKTKQALGTQS